MTVTSGLRCYESSVSPKPRWVIGENVSGFINMALDDVSLDLESEGYEVRPFVLPACAVDAHHRRDRVFIVAYRDPTLAHSHGERQLQQAGFECEVGRWSGDGGKESESVAYATDAGLQRRTLGGDIASEGETAIEQSSRFGDLRRGREWPVEPPFLEWLMGFPIGWTESKP